MPFIVVVGALVAPRGTCNKARCMRMGICKVMTQHETSILIYDR